MVAAVSNNGADVARTIINDMNAKAKGAKLDATDVKNSFASSPEKFARVSQDTFSLLKDGVKVGVEIKVNDDGSISMRAPLGKGDWEITIADSNSDGNYGVTSNKMNSGGEMSGAQEAAAEAAVNNLMENDNVYSSKKKKGGGGLAAASGADSWFIQLAEALGESLNQMANDVKTAVDNVQTKDGQAPFKDSMRIQGLAQQLSFMSQAFMTALNSIGEAKTY